MIETLEENIIFQNKYLTIYNNKVRTTDINEGIVFEHLKLVEGNQNNKAGSVAIIKYENKYLLVESYRYPIEKSIFELSKSI